VTSSPPARRFRLAEGLEVLRSTPDTLSAWLGGLSGEWIHADEGPGTWSPYDVVGHLVHGERTDWIARAKRILEHGDALAFEPFDRFAQLRAPHVAIGERLATFAELRAANLATLEGLGLGEADLDRPGLHPALGPVTMGALLSTWVVHDLGHLAQIARVMAKRYAADVGPWGAYLPVLAPR